MDMDRGLISAKERRHLLIAMARRRARPGTGSSAAFMQARTAMKFWPDLRDTLQDIDWVIVGAVATRAYMPERVTGDLDILVRAGDGDRLANRLKDRKSTRLNSSHSQQSRMPSSA